MDSNEIKNYATFDSEFAPGTVPNLRVSLGSERAEIVESPP